MDKTYDKIFTALDTYVSEILPIKISINEENSKFQTDYDKYQEYSIGKLNEQEKILKKMILLEISRNLFTHSLPMGSAESCYNYLLEKIRNFIVNENDKTKKKKLYEILIRIEDSYNEYLLSGKVYWDNQQEKEQYKKFVDKYKNITSMQDETEKSKQKTIIFVKEDLKRVYKNKKQNKKIIDEYKNYLTELGAMKVYKNKCRTIQTKYIGVKKWSMQK